MRKDGKRPVWRRVVSELRLYLCNEWISCIPGYWLRHCYYRVLMKFELGAGCSVMMHTRFDQAGNLVIGQNSVINQRCRLDSRGGLFIGCNVSVSEEVTILTADHDAGSAGFEGRVRPVKIGDRVWIGTRVLILPGVTVGEGALIAAAAVVTRDVDPYTVVAGVPARQIGTRRSDLIYETRYRRLFH